MWFSLRKITLLAVLLGGLPAISIAQLSHLGINFGPFPIDQYKSANTNGSGPLIQGCSTSITVQQCVQFIVSTGPNSYRSQGVVNVRFMFTLGGGYYSTPLETNGTVSSTWLSLLGQFFSDLHTYGITNVTPTAMPGAPWTVPYDHNTGVPLPGPFVKQVQVSECSKQATLVFFPWLPYGLDVNNSYYADQNCGNASYYYANANA